MGFHVPLDSHEEDCEFPSNPGFDRHLKLVAKKLVKTVGRGTDTNLKLSYFWKKSNVKK